MVGKRRSRRRVSAKPISLLDVVIGGSVVLMGLFVALAAARSDSDRARIEAACETQLQLGPSGCGCIADRAETDLDEQQRQWLVFSVTDHTTAAQQLQMRMTQEQLFEIGNFMATVPADCDRY